MATEAPRELVKRLLTSADPLPLLEASSLSLDEQIEACADDLAVARLIKLHSFWAFKNNDHRKSTELSLRSYEVAPDFEALKNYAIAARKANDRELLAEATRFAESNLDRHDDPEEHTTLLDVLCHNCGQLGETERSREFGRAALAAKDKQVSPSFQLSEAKPKPFSFNTPNRNVISFSLFGADPRYCIFAVENAIATKHVYPGWTSRFYVDETVPKETLAKLKQLGAQLVGKPKHNPRLNTGLFWRFEVASDPNVDYFVVRDADALINVREKTAIDEWLASGRRFHLMRDFHSHSELILAGMWGRGWRRHRGHAGADQQIPNAAAQDHPQPAQPRSADAAGGYLAHDQGRPLHTRRRV